MLLKYNQLSDHSNSIFAKVNSKVTKRVPHPGVNGFRWVWWCGAQGFETSSFDTPMLGDFAINPKTKICHTYTQ